MRRLAATVAAGLVGAAVGLSGGTALAGTAAASSATASHAPAGGAAASTAPSSATAASSSPSAATPAASSNPLCSAEVVDSAGVLSGDDVEQLRSAGQDLAQTTVLRVRTVSSLSGDLASYEQQLERSCGWASASGARQPTLLVLLLDTDDQQTGIYAGPSLTPVLTDKVAQAVEQDAMRAPLAAHDWTAGLQAGIQSLDLLVGPGAAPSASFNPSALASAGAVASASQGSAADASAPVSGVAVAPLTSGGSSFPYAGVGIGAVAVVAVVGGGTALFRRNNLRRPFPAEASEGPWPGDETGIADEPGPEPDGETEAPVSD